jgi:hypothetical protein
VTCCTDACFCPSLDASMLAGAWHAAAAGSLNHDKPPWICCRNNQACDVPLAVHRHVIATTDAVNVLMCQRHCQSLYAVVRARQPCSASCSSTYLSPCALLMRSRPKSLPQALIHPPATPHNPSPPPTGTQTHRGPGKHHPQVILKSDQPKAHTQSKATLDHR